MRSGWSFSAALFVALLALPVSAQIQSFSVVDTGTFPTYFPSAGSWAFTTWGAVDPPLGGVRVRGVAASDRDFAAINHGSCNMNFRYDIRIDIAAQPYQCWSLFVHNLLRGSLIRCDDGNGGAGFTSWSGVSGSLPSGAPYSLVTGSLSFPSRDSSVVGKQAFTETAEATIEGVGSQTVLISYLYTLRSTSEVAGLNGGDEAVARLGLHVPQTGTHFGCYGATYGSDDVGTEGHFVTADLVLGHAIIEPLSDVEVVVCDGADYPALTGLISAPASVQWFKDDSPVGPPQPDVTTTSFVPSTHGVYRFTATAGTCTVTSPAFFVTPGSCVPLMGSTMLAALGGIVAALGALTLRRGPGQRSLYAEPGSD